MFKCKRFSVKVRGIKSQWLRIIITTEVNRKVPTQTTCAHTHPPIQWPFNSALSASRNVFKTDISQPWPKNTAVVITSLKRCSSGGNFHITDKITLKKNKIGQNTGTEHLMIFLKHKTETQKKKKRLNREQNKWRPPASHIYFLRH